MSDNVVLCPFWRESRSHFCVRVCDNLVGGVPLCVVSGFFYHWDEDFEQARMVMSDAELRTKFPEHFVRVEYCHCVVRSDVYDAVKRGGCFFGRGLCVRPEFDGFSGCSADCPCWKG